MQVFTVDNVYGVDLDRATLHDPWALPFVSMSPAFHEGGFYPSTPTGPPVPGHLHAVSIVDGTIAEHGEEVAALCQSASATW